MLKKLLIILSILSVLKADLPPQDGYHVSLKSTYITNVSDFLEYEILGCKIYVAGRADGCYKISDNQNIEKGYKFNHLYLVAIKKDILETLGGINATKLREVDDANELSVQIAQYALDKKYNNIETIQYTHIEDKYPISNDKYYYEITDIKDNMITLKLKQRVIVFTDGREDATIEIEE